MPPNRSAEAWSREFVKALKTRTGVSLRFAEVVRLADKDKRLRERVPASVVLIVEGSAKASGLSIGQWVRLTRRQPGLLARKAKDVARGLKELRTVLGIEEAEALRLATLQPMLLCYAPGGIKLRVAALQKATGLGRRESRQCARRCPNLLTIKPATPAAHIRTQRHALGLTLPDFTKVVLREPRLLVRSPETIIDFLDAMMKGWGLPRQEALELFIKAPKLGVSGLAGTMGANIQKLAHGLGCEKEQLLKAVKSFPMLAYQKPERLIKTLKTGAAALGVSKVILGEAVLRSPSLLVRRIEGWARRMRFVIRIAAALGVQTSAKDVLKMFPAAMTYGEGRLLQRYVMAHLGLGSTNWMALLSLSDERARQKLEDYFQRHRQKRGLQKALKSRGLL